MFTVAAYARCLMRILAGPLRLVAIVMLVSVVTGTTSRSQEAVAPAPVQSIAPPNTASAARAEVGGRDALLLSMGTRRLRSAMATRS